MDSQSASFTCDDSTDEEMHADDSFDQNTQQVDVLYRNEIAVSKGSEGQRLQMETEDCNSSGNSENLEQPIDENYVPGSDKNKSDERPLESDENEGPTSEMLKKGVYYLGEHADNILSRAFPNSKFSVPSYSCGHGIHNSSVMLM